MYKFNKTIWSGGGVVVLEDYRHISGNIIKCMIVSRDRARKSYVDFGGTFEKKDIDIKITAVRECLEESAGLIDINENTSLDHTDIDSGKVIDKKNVKYRAYFVKINGLCRKDFLDNLKKLKNNNAPKFWLETNDIAHIPLLEIEKIITSDNNIVKDVIDRDINLGKRIIDIIKNGHVKIISTSSNETSGDMVDSYHIAKDCFRKNTKTLKIS